MEQAVAASHELYKCAVGHYAAHLTCVYLAHLGNSYNSANLGESAVDSLLAGTCDFYLTYTVNLVNSDGSTSLLLNTLDNLSTRADNSTDELLRYGDRYDAGGMGFEVLAGFGDALSDLAEDVETCITSLLERLFKDLVREAIALDIHLRSGQAIGSTGGFEIHVT